MQKRVASRRCSRNCVQPTGLGKLAGVRGYDAWFARDLNNAQLSTVASYNDWVPAFEMLLDQEEGKLSAFYRRVAELADQEAPVREEALRRSIHCLVRRRSKLRPDLHRNRSQHPWPRPIDRLPMPLQPTRPFQQTTKAPVKKRIPGHRPDAGLIDAYCKFRIAVVVVGIRHYMYL